MKEHQQAFDRRRDEQGTMRLGLYDPKSGRVMIGVARDGTISQDTIGFLAICWEVHGLGVPDALVMDAAKIGKSLVEFLKEKRVGLLLLSSKKIDRCMPLQRAFETVLPPTATGGTSVPAKQL